MKFGGRELLLALLMALCVGLFFVAQQLHATLSDRSIALSSKAKARLTTKVNDMASMLTVLVAAQVLCVVVLFLMAQRSGFGIKSDEVSAALESHDVSRMLKKREDLSQREVIALLENLAVELNEAKSIQRFLMERASHVVCVVDKKGKFISVSKASLSSWGYQSSELEGKNISQVLLEPARVLGIVSDLANTSNKAVVETNLKARDGEVLNVVWTAYWSVSDAALFCVVQDVTERKRVELRLRTTLEALPAGVIITNVDNIIEFANAQACNLLKMEPATIVGQSLNGIWEHRLQKKLDDTLDLDPVYQTMASRKDGTRFPIEVATRIIDMADEIKQLTVFVDISAQKESERLRGEFLAMLTHDMRSPLTSLHGMLGLLDQGVLGDLNDQGRQLVKTVGPKFDRLLRLINDILDLEKIGSGKVQLDRTQLVLIEVIQNAMNVVQLQANEKKIVLQLRGGQCVCWGDRDQLARVVQNILSNAIKFSPENSEVIILAENTASEARVSVIDCGRGIPPEKHSSIFEMFEQVESADAKKRGGTGLGLAICKAIVTEHGGKIGVHNNPERGSTFWFTVPKTELAVEFLRDI